MVASPDQAQDTVTLFDLMTQKQEKSKVGQQLTSLHRLIAVSHGRSMLPYETKTCQPSEHESQEQEADLFCCV